MFQRIIALALVFGITLSASAQNQQPPADDQAKANIGKPAPELDVAEWLTDKSITQDELSGKPYVLEFWATWCAPCKASIPHLNMISQTLEPFGLIVVGLTDEDVETAQPFVEEMGMLYYVASDKNTKSGLTFSGIPFAAVVDTDGMVAWAGHPMDPQFGNAIVEAVSAYAPEAMQEAMQQGLQGNMAGAYATLTAMETEQSQAAVKIIEDNIAAAIAHAETLDGLEKFNALNLVNQFYGTTGAAESVPEKLEAMKNLPEVQAALKDQETLMALEQKVMALQQQAMKSMQEGAAEEEAATKYLTNLIPILENFAEENPEHPETEQIKQVLPMMTQELERMSAAAKTSPDATEEEVPED